jgi:hypothetical protein
MAKLLNQTAPVEMRGGCLSALLYPPIPIIGIFIMAMVFLGETSTPLALANAHGDSVAIPISAKHSAIAPLFTPEVQYWADNIQVWANDWALDPNLVATVMQIESCGDPTALSHAGAMGLFQVMPYHFEVTESPFKPNVNAKRGLNYLQLALAEYNNPSLAFAGYNGGIGTAAKPQSLWPAETIRYTHWGTNIYDDALKNRKQSDTLTLWLESGGASLCAQANATLGLSQ